MTQTIRNRNNTKTARGANRKRGNDKVETEAERKGRLAKEFRIKPKTKQMVDLLLENPKLSQTEAYIRTHGTNNRDSARATASKVLSKPNVIGYRASAVGKAKRRIISLVDSENQSIALKASQDIIDRNEGKSVQKTENLSRTIEVKLDLGQVKLGGHYIKAGE